MTFIKLSLTESTIEAGFSILWVRRPCGSLSLYEIRISRYNDTIPSRSGNRPGFTGEESPGSTGQDAS